MYVITSPDQQNSAASDTFSTIKRGASFSLNGHDVITKNLSFELKQINIKFSFGG